MQDALQSFDYELPEACIAKHPPARREDARLLHVAPSGALADRGVTDLISLLPPGIIYSETPPEAEIPLLLRSKKKEKVRVR